MSSFLSWVANKRDKKDDENKNENANNTQSEDLNPEAVRLKRLRKFEQERAAANRESSCSPAPAASTEENKSRPMEIETTLATPQKPTAKPTVPKTPEASAVPQNRPTTPKEGAQTTQSPAAALAKWENLTIRKIFKVSLSPGTDYFYLENFAQELQREHGQLPMIDRNMMEPIIVERLTAGFDIESPLEYFVGCYERAVSELRTYYKDEERASVLRQAKEFCISYFGLVLQNPDMFPMPKKAKDEGYLHLIPMLAAGSAGLSSTTPEITGEFLNDFCNRFKDEGLNTIFNPIFKELSTQMRHTNLLGNYVPIFRSFTKLTAQPLLAEVLVNHPHFFSVVKSGRALEQASLLGPFFSLAAFYDTPAVGDKFFGEPTKRTQRDVEASMLQLRNQIQMIQSSLHQIFMNLLKPKATRDAAVRWLADAIEGNKTRAKMMHDPLASSSEGFMANLMAVLLKLCEPFVAGGATKYGQIDTTFVLSKSLLDFTDDTRLAASTKEVDDWVDARNYARQQQFKQQSGTNQELKQLLEAEDYNKKTYNFVTQCFFMTCKAILLGYVKTTDLYEKQLMKTLHKVQSAVKDLEDSRPQWSLTPQAQQKEEQLKQLKTQFDKLLTIKFAADVQIFHSEVTVNLMRFFNFSAGFVLKKADPNNTGFPLREPVPMEYAYLPEHLIDNVSEVLLFLARYSPDSLSNMAMLEEPLNMMVTFMGNAKFVRNPYIRAKFTEVLSAFVPTEHSKNLQLSQVFLSHKLSLQHLISGLMQIYVDIEHTGSHTQFFDKFNYRYYISILLKHLWQFEPYRQSFAKESRFVPYMLYD
eukprot:GEZU01024932.1.p1 GENE.GEZU01024932.1~~GEZU01024932.1.p1  ORF type:complete len:813 (-),score=193.46 GEZU01024932.1:75-2513(-)